jgi:hypothetical protein
VADEAVLKEDVRKTKKCPLLVFMVFVILIPWLTLYEVLFKCFKYEHMKMHNYMQIQKIFLENLSV